MGVKLNKETSDVIHVSQMKEGQIAEIINNQNGTKIGMVIQRFAGILIPLGKSNIITFSKVFDGNINKEDKKFYVRILKNGETLTITDNE